MASLVRSLMTRLHDQHELRQRPCEFLRQRIVLKPSRLTRLFHQIDAALVAQHKTVQKQETIVQMENGCICCTLRGDLLEEVAALAAQGGVDYLVIESCMYTSRGCQYTKLSR